MSSEQDFHAGTIAIIGRPNVGKSTLLNKLIGQKISITSRKPQTTRYKIRGILTQRNVQYIFIDTPGFQTQHANALNRAMNKTVSVTLSDSDVVVWVIEALQFNKGDKEIIALLKQLAIHTPLLLVINKIDKVTKKSDLLPFIDNVKTYFSFAEIIPVSAEKNNNLDELLSVIKNYLPRSSALYAEDEMTDHNQRFFAAEILREKLFRLLGDELPYSCSVVIEQFKEQGNLKRIQATIFVSKTAHRGMIIGKKGEKLKAIASQARVDMERLFGNKVFLETHVKIKKDWVDDERMLKSLGFHL